MTDQMQTIISENIERATTGVDRASSHVGHHCECFGGSDQTTFLPGVWDSIDDHDSFWVASAMRNIDNVAYWARRMREIVTTAKQSCGR